MKVKDSEIEHKIPMFSGYRKRRIKAGATILVSALFLLKFSRMEGSNVAQVIIVCAGWFASYIMINGCLNRFMECCMWKLQDDRIKRIMPGKVRDISYEEILEALQTKKVKIAAHAFRVPERRGWISFYYEVGNEEVQKEIKKSYEFLASKVPVELPKMSQRLIGQMDRSFLYRKDRRTGSIFMLIASFFMIFVKYESVPMNIIIISLGLYNQFFMLNKLFKGIYFGKTTEQRIQEMVGTCPNTKLRKVKVSYAQMAVVVLLTASLNLFWLFV